MKNTKSKLGCGLLFVISIAVTGCNGDDIPLVGLDKNSNPVETFLSKPEYTRRLNTAVTAVNRSALPALSHQTQSSGYALRTAVIGMSINAEIGIGPFKIGAVPRFRVAYTNSADPALP